MSIDCCAKDIECRNRKTVLINCKSHARTHAHTHTHTDTTKGGATVVKVGGYNFASGASEKICLTPHLWLTWGDMKQDIAVFFTTIMTSDLD